MIDFSRANLTDLMIHYCGNKGNGEELVLSEKQISLKDDFTRETLLRYFLTPFKTDIYYRFKDRHDKTLNSVANFCEDMFNSRKNFTGISSKIAHHLHDQSIHPKIKGGELFVCYFSDAMVDGELCDAIGIFKTENKETFIRVLQVNSEFDVDYENGIDINKLDKGCLVFNTDKKKGYKLSIVDTNNRAAECALYWEEDFLGATLKTNAYYHTKNFLDASRGFCEEVLTPGNNVDSLDQKMILNRSASFVGGRDRFKMEDYEKEILVQPEVIEAFRDYRKDFTDRMNLTAIDEFDVSKTAVKKNSRYMRSVIKLDKNFHLYIHSRHDYVERGYDEERGLKFYKLFYVNED